jgi:hypothetical protein
VLTIADKEIDKVGIVDDNATARDSYFYTLEDADVAPVREVGPLGSLKEYVGGVCGRLDAVLCDHHLRVANYSSFDGAQLAAALNAACVPAVLCTRWETADLDLIRRYRDRVPALLQVEDLNPESFIDALETTIKELSGEFSQQRRPWRTQVHIADVGREEQDAFFYVDLPAWTSSTVVRLRKADLDPELAEQLTVDARWHAEVNVGAEHSYDLYFRNWEPH